MRGTPRRRHLGKPAEIAVGAENAMNAGRAPVRFCRWDSVFSTYGFRVGLMVSLFFTRKERKSKGRSSVHKCAHIAH